jgi:anti-anti-sigma factor
MDVRLIRYGDYGSQEIPVNVDEMVIGRDQECGLRLDHGKVSLRHCRIFRSGDRILVEDLDSARGTAVNQTILDPTQPPVEVHDGDHLWVGPEYFRVAIQGAGLSDEWTEHRPNPAHRFDAPGDVEIPPNPLEKDDRSTVQARAAHELLERWNSKDEPEEDEAPAADRKGKHAGAGKARSKIDVAEVKGVAVARLLPRVIVADDEIRAIGNELGDLIDSGKNRIALNFGNVERLSSQVIGEVLRVYRRCTEDGGMLKICKVNPQVAAIFAMTNLERHVEVFLDEKPAVESAWPKTSRPAPPPPAGAGRPADRAAAATPAAPAKRVRLVVDVGKAKGRVVEIRAAKFVIGRDERCQLRPNDEAVSRLHAVIEQRGGRVAVRDLGSTSGTILNGRMLRDETADIAHGDRLQVGSLAFLVTIEDRAAPQATRAEEPAEDLPGWPSEGQPPVDSSKSTIITRSPLAPPGPPDHPPGPAPHPSAQGPQANLRYLRHETVSGIGVVTLLVEDLYEEPEVDAVRSELQALLDQAPHRRLVVRFDHVRSLSRRAAMMLLSRAQHFRKDHGTMRLCRVSPQVRATMEETQLPHQVGIFMTLHEALKTHWETEPDLHEGARRGAF